MGSQNDLGSLPEHGPTSSDSHYDDESGANDLDHHSSYSYPSSSYHPPLYYSFPYNDASHNSSLSCASPYQSPYNPITPLQSPYQLSTGQSVTSAESRGRRLRSEGEDKNIPSNDGVRKLQCPSPSCASSFRRTSDLRRHIRTIHHVSTIYYCDVPSCSRNSRGFARKDKLTEHLRRVHPDKPVRHTEAATELEKAGEEAQTGALDDVNQRVTEEPSKKKPKPSSAVCPRLSCIFWKLDPIRWTGCGDMGYASIAALRVHLERKHRIFECGSCFQAFMNDIDRQKHKESTSHCSRCTSVFNRSDEVQKHLSTECGGLLRPAEKWRIQYRNHCGDGREYDHNPFWDMPETVEETGVSPELIVKLKETPLESAFEYLDRYDFQYTAWLSDMDQKAFGEEQVFTYPSVPYDVSTVTEAESLRRENKELKRKNCDLESRNKTLEGRIQVLCKTIERLLRFSGGVEHRPSGGISLEAESKVSSRDQGSLPRPSAAEAYSNPVDEFVNETTTSAVDDVYSDWLNLS